MSVQTDWASLQLLTGNRDLRYCFAVSYRPVPIPRVYILPNTSLDLTDGQFIFHYTSGPEWVSYKAGSKKAGLDLLRPQFSYQTLGFTGMTPTAPGACWLVNIVAPFPGWGGSFVLEWRDALHPPLTPLLVSPQLNLAGVEQVTGRPVWCS